MRDWPRPRSAPRSAARRLSTSRLSASMKPRPLLAYMLVIHHRGRAAAFVTSESAGFAANVATLEADHPIRRWVACLAFFALDVLEGRLPGPYTPARAEYFARCAL